MSASQSVSTSWASTVHAAFDALIGAPHLAALLSRTFDDIADGWGHYPSSGPLPFSSGVCPDGSPVEASIRFAHGRPREYRFIAQPWRCADGQTNLRDIRSHALRFVEQHSTTEAREFLERTLSIYPDGTGRLPFGNFFLWLGRSGSESRSGIKVYLNPWAASHHRDGFLAIDHVLRGTSFHEEAIAWVMRFCESTIRLPHIIGMNFEPGGALSVKIYFTAHETRGSLIAMSDAWRTNGGEVADLSALFKSGCFGSEGEVHSALTLAGGKTPSLRFNFLCADWFGSDQEVIEAVARTGGVDIARELGRLAEVDGRQITFASWDTAAVTLYLRVASGAQLRDKVNVRCD